MDQERCGHDVAQEPEPRHDRRERPWLRHDVDELDLEQITRLGACDEDRPRQRMDYANRQSAQVGDRGLRVEIAIERVTRFQHDLLARLDLDRRRHVRMPAVVAGIRLLVEVLASIDGDALGRRAHCCGCHPWKGAPRQ